MTACTNVDMQYRVWKEVYDLIGPFNQYDGAFNRVQQAKLYDFAGVTQSI